MSNLTTEQLAELTERVNDRIAEWEFPHNHSGIVEKLPRGVVRLVHDVIQEWWDEATLGDPQTDAYGLGYQDGAIDAATFARIGNGHANSAVAIPFANLADVTFANLTDAAITPTDYAEFEAVWPSIPDLQGEDVFAAEHGAPTGEPEQEPAPEPPRPIGRDRAPDVVAINKPRPLSVVDAEAKRQAELAEIVAHLQSIAKGDRLPTMTDYHGARPKHLPMWATMQSRHNLSSWSDLAALTGLEYGKRHLRVAGDADDAADDDVLDISKPSKPKPITDNRKRGPTREEVIAFLQSMAMAGVMPTQMQFNVAKPVTWGTATAQVSRFGATWDELRIEAGLQPNPQSAWQQADAAA